jgi:hypothetical protein
MRYTNTSAVTMLLREPLNIAAVTTYKAETNLATVNGQMGYYELIIPPTPLELSLQNTHGANTLNFRATLVYGRPFTG